MRKEVADTGEQNNFMFVIHDNQVKSQNNVIANEVKQSHGLQIFDIEGLLRHSIPCNDPSGNFLRPCYS
jgi:hypothetical protein